MAQNTLSATNIVDQLDDDELKKLGYEIIDGFEEDLGSRSGWIEKTTEWMNLATQVKETKSFPWPNAANVKYPLLTTAAMQFAARAYPALIPSGNKLVSGVVTGRDQDGSLGESATRVGKHMSYQLLYEMPTWEEDMDKLCLVLPIIGCAFKKSYYDPLAKANRSDLVLPKDLVINYFAKTLEDAYRKSHIIELDSNKVYERKAKGIFRDIDYGEAVDSDLTNRIRTDADMGLIRATLDNSTPHTFIECHTYADLDDDGYAEPYIITVHYESKKVARIVPRFNEADVEYEGKKILAIKPKEYFTKFGFIPNPDGSIYDLGFGLLLGGINDTVNTLTNQLLDSGTLNNLQAGFLGRGIRIRAGNTRFTPGEWKPVDFTGDDIKRHIFPMPTKEPSNVLFQLLQTLVTSGKELASVAEIFTGKMPGQNTPATTTMASIEQGLKVFTAIYKRIYRSLSKEYQKLYDLNLENVDQDVYFTLNEMDKQTGEAVYQKDYSSKVSVKPGADPNVASESQKLAKAQGLLEMLQLGTINPQVVTKRVLEAQEQYGVEELMQMPQQGPSPEQQKAQADMQAMQQKAQQDAQAHDAKLKEMQMQAMIKEHESALKQQAAMMQNKLDAQGKAMELRIKEVENALKLQHDQRMNMIELAKTVNKAHADKVASDIKVSNMQHEHEQKMKQSQAEHKQKLSIKKTQDGYEVG